MTLCRFPLSSNSPRPIARLTALMAAATLALAFLPGVALADPDGPYHISGTVTGSDGAPLANIDVWAKDFAPAVITIPDMCQFLTASETTAILGPAKYITSDADANEPVYDNGVLVVSECSRMAGTDYEGEMNVGQVSATCRSDVGPDLVTFIRDIKHDDATQSDVKPVPDLGPEAFLATGLASADEVDFLDGPSIYCSFLAEAFQRTDDAVGASLIALAEQVYHPSSTPENAATPTPTPAPFVPAAPPIVPPAPGPQPTCRPSAANDQHIQVCVPAYLWGASVGDVSTTSPTGQTATFSGSLAPGYGLTTGANSSAVVSDPQAGLTLSIGSASRIISNIRGYYDTLTQEPFTCGRATADCDLTAAAQPFSEALNEALKSALEGKTSLALFQLDQGTYDLYKNAINYVAGVAGVLSSGHTWAVDPAASNVAVTVNEKGSEFEVLSGSWLILNLDSGQFVSLTAGQRILIPADTTAAAAQNLAGSVTSFDPSAINQWWAAPASGGAGNLGIPPVAFALVTLLLLLLLAVVAVVLWQKRRSRLAAVPLAPPVEEGQSGDGVTAAGPPAGAGPPPPYYYAPPGYAPASPGSVPYPGYAPYPWPAPPKARPFQKTLLVIPFFALIVVFVGTFWLVSENLKPSTVSSLSNPSAPGATASATLAPFDVGNPTGNDTAIGQTIGKACTSTSTLAACQAASLTGLNQARTQEGLPKLTLPDGFWSQGYDQQLLFLLNAERTSRNLALFEAVYPSLNADALAAAQTQEAPSLAAQASVSGFGGWSGGEMSNVANTVWIVFAWDYYDGPGSGEAHCTAADASGCWAMREAVLRDFESTATSTLAFGAACVSTTNSYSVGKQSLACAWEGGPVEKAGPGPG